MYGNYYGGYPMYMPQNGAVPDQLAQYKQPYQQPMQMPQQPQMQPQQQTSITEIGKPVWAQGRAGANGFYVPAGQTAWIMDSEDEYFYIKKVDINGRPLPLRIFAYHEITNEQTRSKNSMSEQAQNVPQIDMSRYITREELEEKLAQLIPNQPKRTKKEDTVNE